MKINNTFIVIICLVFFLGILLSRNNVLTFFNKSINYGQLNNYIIWGDTSMNFPPIKSSVYNKKPVKVAILDSGVNSDDPVLKSHILNMFDCISNTNMCLEAKSMKDTYGHGSEIAKIISSFSPSINLIPIKVINNNGEGNIKSLIEGINIAIQSKVNVINLSLQINDDIDDLHNVIKKAYKNNITVVASTGNNGVNILSYPAKYKEVISVGSYSQQYKKSDFSQYGKGIDFVGPGEFGDKNKHYIHTKIKGAFLGTSYAAAFVTKAISLYYSNNQVNSQKELLNILTHSTKSNLNNIPSLKFGYGIIDVKKLLAYNITQ